MESSKNMMVDDHPYNAIPTYFKSNTAIIPKTQIKKTNIENNIILTSTISEKTIVLRKPCKTSEVKFILDCPRYLFALSTMIWSISSLSATTEAAMCTYNSANDFSLLRA